ILGNIVTRFWAVWSVVWVLGLALAWILAPSWEDVAEFGEVASLPPNSPSVLADQLYAQAFQDEYSPSSVVLVFSRDESELTGQDFDLIDPEIRQRIIRSVPRDEEIITNVLSPKLENIGTLLVSPDKKSALLLAPLKTPFQDRRNIAVIEKIE